jgi:predicted phosphohydrolase
MSDLHFEFQADGGRDFIAQIFDSRVDVLVIAGDLSNAPYMEHALYSLSRVYKHTLILFVPGNHDFYKSSIQETLCYLSRLEERIPNFRCLYNSSMTVCDRLFIGATLWFPRTSYSESNQHKINDFYCIDNFYNDVYSHNDYAVKYLTSARIAKSCVITHHVPTRKSVAHECTSDPINAFRVCPMDRLIVAKRPYSWIHGHTHHSFDYLYYETRVVCNPFGYSDRKENKHFNKKLLLEF